MFKDYCHTLGLCFGGVLSFTFVLWLSLIFDQQYQQDLILYHCSRFIITGSFVAIIVVSLAFLNMSLLDIRKKHRQKKLNQQKTTD